MRPDSSRTTYAFPIPVVRFNADLLLDARREILRLQDVIRNNAYAHAAEHVKADETIARLQMFMQGLLTENDLLRHRLAKIVDIASVSLATEQNDRCPQC